MANVLMLKSSGVHGFCPRLHNTDNTEKLWYQCNAWPKVAIAVLYEIMLALRDLADASWRHCKEHFQPVQLLEFTLTVAFSQLLETALKLSTVGSM